MSLITTKPIIYLVNLTMKDYLRQKSKYLPPIAAWVTAHGGLPRDVIPFSIEFEEKAYSLRNDPDALKTFLGEGKVKSRLEKIITEGTILASSLSFPSISIKASDIKMKPGFTKLGLQYYFTAGEKEIRCWTIPRGCLAPQAAGAIHTDFERGFIKAEVVAYADFHDLCDGAKSMAPIKAAGKYRQEGGKYVVQDGDIIHFQFSEFENAKGTGERLISGRRCRAEQVEEGGGGEGMGDRVRRMIGGRWIE
jgi:obg-like ATPase 1